MVLLPAGYRLIEIGETASTNTACLEAAQAGDAGKLWIRAGRQLAGRGSRGRAWVSKPGNLFASLLLTDPAPAAALANLTFVASLAVREALADLAAAHRRSRDISLKWPNDVLLSHRKVSGILLESHQIDRRRAVIIGIGINCVDHPDDTVHPATDLAGEGMATPARDVLELVAAGMDNWLKRWDRGTNFAEIRRHWLSHATGLGDRIKVRLGGNDLSGVFEDIDEAGILLLRRDNGELARISTADVFFETPQEGGDIE